MFKERQFDNLMLLFFRLVQSEARKNIDESDQWRNDAQVIAIKIFRHISSVKQLAAGVGFQIDGSQRFEFIDHSSVTIITRAALEAYLTFNYIYINTDEELSIYRHNIWQLGGLIDRGKLFVNTSQANEQRMEESIQIDQLKVEISKSKFFIASSSADKKSILAGRWRSTSGWAELAKGAGIHKTYFANIYNHLSGHSHASFISALQIRDAKDIISQKFLVDAMKQICCVILAHFCFSYVKLFPLSEGILKSDEELFESANMWFVGSEDMNKIYGAS